MREEAEFETEEEYACWMSGVTVSGVFEGSGQPWKEGHGILLCTFVGSCKNMDNL